MPSHRAVGDYITSAPGDPTVTLVERWNGTAWTQVPSPSPSAAGNELSGVAATSASNVWAVGGYFLGSHEQTERALAFHCC